jgi:malate dehydrogenase
MTVAITGGCGNISYSLAFRVANGDLLGRDQPVIINLVDIPEMENKLKGVKMELDDCAFPLLVKTNTTSKLADGFKDIDVALMVGSKPRTQGMERGDLLKQNGKIFVEQGKALGDHAKRSVKVLVVGNPANTNCLIAMKNAHGLKPENFNAMTRLDHNRALSQLALKAGVPIQALSKVAIWGNHSSTMYADLNNTTINGKKALDVVNRDWYEKEFIPSVAQRGAEIIKARGASSAASAANAAIDHVRDWVLGHNDWVSMSIPTDGKLYDIPKDLIFSFPCTTSNGNYKVVDGLKLDQFSLDRIKKTTDELISERNEVEHLLK